MVSCGIVCNLNTKPIPTFYIGDRIKAKLTELRFKCRMQATRLQKMQQDMRYGQLQQADEGKY